MRTGLSVSIYKKGAASAAPKSYFVKKVPQNFLSNRNRQETARRAVNHPISLDAEPEELERIGPAASDEDPERVCHREWFRSLMRLSVEALRESLRRDGKETYFEVFRMYHLRADAGTAGDPAEKPSYGDIAARLSIQESDVGNYLILARGALDRILRERIREYVATDADVDEELMEVFRR